jgi:hypothetical protein
MAVGSGLAGQLGLKAETTYGTYVAPDRFLVGYLRGAPKFAPTRVQGGGLYAGEAAVRGERYVETTRQGTCTFTFEVSKKQAGIILAHLLGSSTTPVVQGATIAYLQTHTLAADQLGKSMTFQVGIPDTSGTVRPYSFLGGKIQKATFACGVDEILTCDVDVDFRDLTEAQTIVAASYPTGAIPFHFKEMAVKLGTYNSEVSVTGVRKVTLTIDRPLKDDRFYAGAAGLKAEPITNGPVAISGSLDIDYVDKTLFVDRFVANTATSMVLEWVGPIIASSFNNTIRFKLPQTFFTGDSPDLDGADVVSLSIPFEAKYDGTNAAVIAEYMSTETSV